MRRVIRENEKRYLVKGDYEILKFSRYREKRKTETVLIEKEICLQGIYVHVCEKKGKNDLIWFQ